MYERDIQLFLTLMDTVHDYGNTNRVKTVLNKQGKQNDANNVNDADAEPDPFLSTDNMSFNPAFLIDFLMLGYIHPFFKGILGLDEQQHYLKRKSNCRDPTKNYVKNDDLTKTICEKFYFPTYAERVVFRSIKPEDITKAIVFEYMQTQRNISYDESSNVAWKDKKTIPRQSCCTLLLGKKATVKSGKGSGIYETSDTDVQGLAVYDVVKRFFGATGISYVTDANKINNEWFCVNGKPHTYYQGKFMNYDSCKQGTKTQTGGNSNDELDFGDEHKTSCFKSEFQEYELSKKNGELLFIDKLFVQKDIMGIYEVVHDIGKHRNNLIDTKDTQDNSNTNHKSKDPTGLSLFLLIFNEINKKTLGFKNLNKQTIRDLKEKINDVGLQSLKETYKITLTDVDEEDNDYVKLSPEDFVLALIDLKRSMDYLYVKAACEANKKRDGTTYVFVSSDRSAICYALFLGTPCIHTGLIKGVYSMTMYNPNATTKTDSPSIDFFSRVEANAERMQRASYVRNARSAARFIKDVVEDIDNTQAEDTEQSLVRKCREFVDMVNEYSEKEPKTKKRIPNPFGSYIYSTNKKEIANITRLCREKFERTMNAPSARKNDTRNTSRQQPQAQTKNNARNSLNPQNTQNTSRQQAQAQVRTKNNIGISQNAQNAPQTSKQARTRVFDEVVRAMYSIIPSGNAKFKRAEINVLLAGHGVTLEDICAHLSGSDDEIHKKILRKLPKGTCPSVSQTTSGGTTFEIPQQSLERRSLLDEEIPIDASALDSICEEGSPFFVFLQFYGQLSPTVSFFWFVTFKSLFFYIFGDDMDRADCVRFKTALVQDHGNADLPPPTAYRFSRTTSLRNGTSNGARGVSGTMRTLSTNDSHGFPPLDEGWRNVNDVSRRK